jgi:hypothetical protein
LGNAAGMAGCVVLGWFAFVRGARVPLLGLVDLGFHELGHLLTYPFPDVMTAMMGSVTQVAVPLGVALYFLFLRKDRLAGGLCLAWAATSPQDASVYIADAPTQSLPLLGEGIHGWAFVLGRWHAIDRPAPIGTGVKAFGLAMLFAGFAIYLWNLVLEEPPDQEQRWQDSRTPVDWSSR